MAQTTRNHLSREARTYVLVSIGAFAIGLVIGFASLGGLH